ncbi:MAG: GAF domain-containing protein [Elusimicrobia bacterium]|nr:GAF domain-containing protein [Elusimicrobiota bacterium]
MNYYALCPSIVTVFVLVLGFFVLLKNRKNKLNLIYFYLSISLFLWLLFFSLMYWNTGKYELSYMLAKFGFIGVILTPVCALHFIAEFLDSRLKKYAIYFYLATIPMIILNFSSHLIYSGLSLNFWGYYPIAGKLYFIALFQFVATFLVATVVLFKYFFYKDINLVKKEQIKYLIMAFSIALLASGDYIIKYPFINFYPIGYIVVIFFSFLMALNAIKNNLMDIRLAITHSTIFFALYIVVLGVPIYVGFVLYQWTIAFVLVFILSSMAPVVLRLLQKKAERILLAEQEKYQQLLIQASKGMIEQHEINKLSKLIVRIIKQSVKIKFVVLYLFDEEKNCFYNISSRVSGDKVINSITFKREDLIIKYMKAKKTPFLYFGLRESLKKEFSKICSDINLIVPSLFRDEILGFLLLGEKENKTLYSAKDMDLFKTLANQASLAIENCFFLEKSKHQQEKLFEAEKLASIGGMADGMAHQIRNRLNSFNLAAETLSFDIEDLSAASKELVEQDKVKDIITDMSTILSSIKSNVTKTNTILTGILNFAKRKESDIVFEYFSLKEVLKASILLVEVKHHKEMIPITLDIPEKDTVYGIKIQLQEVFFNFIDNALEAVIEKQQHIKSPFFDDIEEKDFVPKINISLKYTDNNRYQVIFKDNGIGVKEEDKPKIFSAFFTTKPSSKSGSGIGSYVAKRMIVEAHKGSISFDSKYGRGTVFIITLPLSQKN